MLVGASDTSFSSMNSALRGDQAPLDHRNVGGVAVERARGLIDDHRDEVKHHFGVFFFEREDLTEQLA